MSNVKLISERKKIKKENNVWNDRFFLGKMEDYAKKNKKKNTNNISLNKSSINNKSQLYRSMNNNNMTPMQTLGNNA